MARKKLSKMCEGCEVSFAGTSKQRYCSRSCGLSHASVSRAVVCVDCVSAFTYAGRGRKLRCEACCKKHASVYQMQWRAARDPSIKIGVGSGGNQWGADNSQWKPEYEHKNTKYKGNYRTRCFKRFGKECLGVGQHRGGLEAHHIDGNPDNFSRDNLIPLCNACHWSAHRRKWKRSSEYIAATYAILSQDGRNKIAELSGNTEMSTRTEGAD